MIKVCDFCENRAKEKCVICDKDCCDEHYASCNISIGREAVARVTLCKRCRGVKIDDDFKKEVSDKLIEHLKKNAVLNALGEDKIEEEPIRINPYLPITTSGYKYPQTSGIRLGRTK